MRYLLTLIFRSHIRKSLFVRLSRRHRNRVRFRDQRESRTRLNVESADPRESIGSGIDTVAFAVGAIAATASAAVLSFVQTESNDGTVQAFASGGSFPTDGMSLSIYVGDGAANGTSTNASWSDSLIVMPDEPEAVPTSMNANLDNSEPGIDRGAKGVNESDGPNGPMTNSVGESGASVNPNAVGNPAVSAQGAQSSSNAVASASSGATDSTSAPKSSISPTDRGVSGSANIPGASESASVTGHHPSDIKTLSNAAFGSSRSAIVGNTIPGGDVFTHVSSLLANPSISTTTLGHAPHGGAPSTPSFQPPSITSLPNPTGRSINDAFSQLFDTAGAANRRATTIQPTQNSAIAMGSLFAGDLSLFASTARNSTIASASNSAISLSLPTTINHSRSPITPTISVVTPPTQPIFTASSTRGLAADMPGTTYGSGSGTTGYPNGSSSGTTGYPSGSGGYMGSMSGSGPDDGPPANLYGTSDPGTNNSSDYGYTTVTDESSVPAIQLAIQADQAAYDAAALAADTQEQQAIDADNAALTQLENSLGQSYQTSALSTQQTFGQSLANDNASNDAAMAAANAAYRQSLQTDANDLDAATTAAVTAFNFTADTTNGRYNSTVDTANALYVSTETTNDVNYLATTRAADNAYNTRVTADDQNLSTQTAALQLSLNNSVTTADSAYAQRVANDQATLRSTIQTQEQLYQTEYNGAEQQQAQTDAAAAATATQDETRADAVAQGSYDQNQATYDQGVTAAEATYASGTNDQTSTTVPDFSQNATLQAAVQTAKAVETAANLQTDAILNQQIQSIETTLQAAYTTATATYNQAIAVANAAEITAQIQADQTYNMAIADHKTTHDSDVATANAAYVVSSQATQTTYAAAVALSGQQKVAAKLAADSARTAVNTAATTTFTQIQQQAILRFATEKTNATNAYNASIQQAQVDYDAKPPVLEAAFKQANQTAKAAFDTAVQQAADARTVAFDAAQAKYDAADVAAKLKASNARKAATNAFIAKTNPVDSAYESSRKTVNRAYQSDMNAAQQKYNDALKPAVQAFWDFMNNTFYPGMMRISQQYQNDPAGAQAATEQLNNQRREAQKTYALAQDSAQVTLAEDQRTAQVKLQIATNAVEKTKFDAYTLARKTYYDAVDVANGAYTKGMAQPLADLQTDKATAQKIFVEKNADAGQTQANAKAEAEATYDSGMTAAKKILADLQSNAAKTEADAIDAAQKTRDTTIADAALVRDNTIADADKTWKDAYETASRSEEQTNVAAYSAYISTLVNARQTQDATTTAADVTQEVQDAASGVLWTDTVADAWDARIVAEDDALAKWYDTTKIADTVALEAAKTDVDTWNSTEMTAWQTAVTSIISAAGTVVDTWATQSGTRYAHLIDVEVADYLAAIAGNVLAEMIDEEAWFNDEVGESVTDAESADAADDTEVHDLQGVIDAEALAVVSDVKDESQAANAEVVAIDAAWQADEAMAVADEMTRDFDVRDAAVIDANADQCAADAWESTESDAASADVKTVAGAEDMSADAEADATKTADDSIVNAEKSRDDKNATAAKKRDETVAAIHHDGVIAESAKLDAAVHAAADGAAAEVTAEAQAAPAAIAIAVDAALADGKTKHAESATETIAATTSARSALVDKVQKTGDDAVRAAEKQRTDDAALPASNVRFTSVNPTPNDSGWQILYNYIPSWQTVAIISVSAAALLIPGAGPVIFAIGMGMLAAQTAYSSYDRYFNQGQSGIGAFLGAGADATGIGTLYSGITNRDIISGDHLGLTDAQRRTMQTEGGFQTAMTLIPVVKGVKSFTRGKTTTVPKTVAEPVKPPASQAVTNIFRKLTSSELKDVAGSPTTIKQLRILLGKLRLLDSCKVKIAKASPSEVPTELGIIYGWISTIAGKVVSDKRGRPIIKLTLEALKSLESAVKTLGHELHHVKEARAGTGPNEAAAEAAGAKLWQTCVQLLGN